MGGKGGQGLFEQWVFWAVPERNDYISFNRTRQRLEKIVPEKQTLELKNKENKADTQIL